MAKSWRVWLSSFEEEQVALLRLLDLERSGLKDTYLGWLVGYRYFDTSLAA